MFEYVPKMNKTGVVHPLKLALLVAAVPSPKPALQEKEYNPYYAFLGQKFCELKRSHQVRDTECGVLSL